MNDLASNQALGWGDVFVASRLIVSLVIGFLAGIVAAIAIGVDTSCLFMARSKVRDPRS
jgi:hypothetical protein